MFKTKEMSKVLVFGLNKDMSKVINTLHKLSVYHIIEHEANEEDIDIGRPLENSEEISKSFVKAKALTSLWNIKRNDYAPSSNHLELSSTIKKINIIHSKNSELQDNIKSVSENILQLNELKINLSLLKKFKIDPEYINGLKSVVCVIGSVKTMEGIKETINKITTNYDFSIDINHKAKQNSIALIIDRKFEENVIKSLQPFGFTPINIQSLSNLTGDVSKNISQTLENLKKLEKEKIEIENKAKFLRQENAEFVHYADKLFSKESDKSEAPLKFAVSNNLFFIKGYVPKEDFDKLKHKLEYVVKDRIYIKQDKVDEHDNIPIKFNNPAPANNFEFLMELYALPKYAEFDPTLLTFITFPLLFGFMLGDVGYGIVTLILFLTLRRFVPSLKQLFNIFITSSVWTIVFGFLFGEVFGEEIIFGYELPRVLSRVHEINSLLILSLIVGIVHLNIGLIIGFYNEYKAHGFKAAMLEKFSWIMFQVSIGLIVLSVMYNTLGIWNGIVLALISVIMIYKGEGLKGIVELPGIFSNILSYSRLMAIGLASASLAVVINQFAKEFFSQGLSGIIPAILILVLGHTINIALGLLGPFLHSLRLHYVEFFGKFYKGGGQRFTPFGIEK